MLRKLCEDFGTMRLVSIEAPTVPSSLRRTEKPQNHEEQARSLCKRKALHFRTSARACGIGRLLMMNILESQRPTWGSFVSIIGYFKALWPVVLGCLTFQAGCLTLPKRQSPLLPKTFLLILLLLSPSFLLGGSCGGSGRQIQLTLHRGISTCKVYSHMSIDFSYIE